MKSTVVLTPNSDDTLSWRGENLHGVGSAAEFAALPASHQADLVLAVPAHKVLLQQVTFEPGERRLLRQTVPFALEERLLDDVDTQHFALGPIEGQQVPVAIVQQQWFADCLQRCVDAGLDVKHATPEILLLPWTPDSWTLWPQGERWLVRIDRWRGFALEADSAKLALQIVLNEAEQPPQKLVVFSDRTDADQIAEWQNQLPELLRGIVELRSPQMSAATVAFDAPQTPLLDFLQGKFARRLPWQRWWSQWRIPLIAAAIAVLVQFVVAGIQHYRLQKENLALRQQIEAIYRRVEPAGAVVEPERQLRRKVQSLQGAQGSNVMPLLQRLGAAIKTVDGIAIQTLNYTGKQGELRLNIIANSFKDVETLRAAIVTAGLEAQLIGSNADGDHSNPKTRAQLRITERH